LIAIDILKKQFEIGKIWDIFENFPGGISVANDISCQTIIHNSMAAQFLRINALDSFSHSAPEPHLVKVLHKSTVVSNKDMPMQRSAWLGEMVSGFELTFHWNDGIAKTALWSSCPLINESGEIVGVLATCEDITERGKLEEELRNYQETHYRLALSNITDAIIIFDLQLNIIYLNYAAEKLLALSQDAIGQNLLSVISFDPILSEKFLYSIATKESLEFRNQCACTGNWTETNTYPSEFQLLVCFRDITQKRELEQEILRLGQLNLVGEIAASIAHEVRNPMTTVRGYLQLFQRNSQFITYSEQIQTMIEELDRANSIITEFLSLAKVQASEMKLANFNNIINILFPLLQADVFYRGHNVQLETSHIPDILLDEKEIRQLILNLVRNAVEAMGQAGVVTIKTYRYIDNIILEISDNGKGIPQELVNQLGTPFLTTKQNGTGLGLAVVYRIAQHHRAKIDIDTSEYGTTFYIAFPINH